MNADKLWTGKESLFELNENEYALKVMKRLLKDGISLASAESCTGGLFAKTVTDVPGISEIFDRGIVTYSCRAKEEELGVSHDTLEAHGAVSPETAVEMAEGLAKKTGCRCTVSITGVAGPSGGTPEKPLGLIYSAAYLDGKVLLSEGRFGSGDRPANRRRGLLMMLAGIEALLDGAGTAHR